MRGRPSLAVFVLRPGERQRRGIAAVLVAGALALAFGVALLGRSARLAGLEAEARCGPGFVPNGARCAVAAGSPCPSPLEETTRGCDAPDRRVLVPAAAMAIGPSDWEAEGRIGPRRLRVAAFRIDAFEVTRAQYAGSSATGDGARAEFGVTRAEAAAFCASRGGRLPTEDEWMVAAASAVDPPRRYPWGDTGAVCRRAAWGLDVGPCGSGAGGPDTVGAHPDGDTAWGLHDVSGNVAEWVAPDPRDPDVGVAKGGSWRSALATDLRVWARLELPPESRDQRVGLRCAYPP
jgi:formylglycine-generating enzyme required for sulfatase activity